MSARAELEARARAGFRAVMLSNHTAEKFASESSARELRFLCSVFDEECSWREKSKRERLLKRARFPVPKTFDGYDWSRIRLPEGMPRNDVESCAFVGSMQNLVLYGGVGNGKTHMAIACGTTACRMGLSVMFTTISDLVVRMQKAEEAGSLDRVFREVERADLVILDELGYLPIDRQGARLLFQVVSKCCERRSLIVTTNLEFSRWGVGADRRPDGRGHDRQDNPLRPPDRVRGAHQEDGGFAHGKQALGERVKRHALPNIKSCSARPESFACHP